MEDFATCICLEVATDILSLKKQGRLSWPWLVSGKRAAGGSCREGFAGDDKAQADRHHRQLLVGPQLEPVDVPVLRCSGIDQ